MFYASTQPWSKLGAVLIRAVDQTLGEQEWRDFVVSQSFGHLACSGVNREVPIVVPTQFDLADDTVVLHLTRANPVWAALEENPRALLSVAGDWAYIPTSWKAIGDEDPTLGIPTTYYASVQLVGTTRPVEDPAELAGLLRRQLSTLEPDRRWADPSVHEKQFPAIRGLVLEIDDVRGKFKYGGNVNAEHRLAIAAKLANRANPGDRRARSHLLRRLGAEDDHP
jgi:transcriptional regulator